MTSGPEHTHIGAYRGADETPEHRALRRAVRDLLQQRSPIERTRRVAASEEPFDRDLWRALAQEVGVVGLMVPEEFGGAGASFAEVGIVLEELGRSLSCVPYLSTAVLAACVLVACEDDAAQAEFLPPITRGESIATVVLPQPRSLRQTAQVTVEARLDGTGWALHGAVGNVFDGAAADLLLVPARCEEEVNFFAVSAEAAHLTIVSQETFDTTRRQAQVGFDGAPARPVTGRVAGSDLLDYVYDVTFAALAADQMGGAAETLAAAAEYAKTRVQFGRKIGSYQAITHKCADMLVASEAARSAGYHALGSIGESSRDRALAASLAKAACDDSALFCAEQNIQIHGGIGCTWEHPAHLYLRRAKSTSMLLGDGEFHRRRLAEQIMLDGRG